MDSLNDIANDIITSHNRHFHENIPLWSDENNMCLLYSNGKISSCGLDNRWWEKMANEQDEIMTSFCEPIMRLPFRHFGSKITFAVLRYEECLAYRSRLERLH